MWEQFVPFTEVAEETLKQQLIWFSSVFNLMGAQGMTYGLQTKRLYILCGRYIDRASVQWCLPAVGRQGILHILQYPYSVHPHYRSPLVWSGILQGASPFRPWKQTLSTLDT